MEAITFTRVQINFNFLRQTVVNMKIILTLCLQAAPQWPQLRCLNMPANQRLDE